MVKLSLRDFGAKFHAENLAKKGEFQHARNTESLTSLSCGLFTLLLTDLIGLMCTCLYM